MLRLGWQSHLPKGLRSPRGTGWDSEVWGIPRWKETQVLLSARSAQAAVVLGTNLAFQFLLLPFLAESGDQRYTDFKEFYQCAAQMQEELLTETRLPFL